jgi:predicted adenine nucleotide alpha hydrolase (AANH) superfamily ATPase
VKSRRASESNQPFSRREVQGRSVLLHACCAPDCTTVLEWWKPLVKRLAVYFYNPNVFPPEEYERRLDTMRVVAKRWTVELIEGAYEADVPSFDSAFRPYAGEPEGGERCGVCFELRLRACAQKTSELGYDAFATTLTISPHKNHGLINAIGARVGAEFGVDYIPTNFKRREGFKRSVEISRRLKLYRQKYCGCRYSLPERLKAKG